MTVLDRFRLDGKRMFITGGSRGLGREMSLAIAEAGADVALCGRDAETLQATADEVRARGRQAWTFSGDVSQPEQCEQLCHQVLETCGQIDILINNAGGRRENIPTEDMPLETWRQLMDLNLTSVFVCTKVIGGNMIRRGQGGRIINISSINGIKGQFGQTNYSAAKAGVHGFTKALAQEVARKGVTVNTVSPGYLATEMVMAVREGVRQKIIDAIPVGRLGQPDEIAALVAFIASDAAAFMTGSNVAMNGGQHMY